MPWFQTNPTIKRKTVRGETLTVSHPNLVTYLIKSTFEGCDISLTRPARGLIIHRCLFRDCTVRAKKPQANHQLFTSTFERCKFLNHAPAFVRRSRYQKPQLRELLSAVEGIVL